MSEPATLTIVPGVDALARGDGPLFAVVGVFDGMHLGHAWLLERLVEEARRLDARPTVITFDSHPDEVLLGVAPPLLIDPRERLRMLADAGVDVAIVQHFDADLRRTPYDAFVRRITDRTPLAGLLMTPDAAFGYERRGTPDTLRDLGQQSRPPFEVVVVPAHTVDGRPVSSSEIRRLVQAGDLAGAERLLGRPHALIGEPVPVAADRTWLGFGLPVALPPEGSYPVAIQAWRVDGAAAAIPARATIEDGGLTVAAGGLRGPTRIAFGSSRRG